jgi:hypothetical protein
MIIERIEFIMQRRTSEQLIADYTKKKDDHLAAAAKWEAKIVAVKNRKPKDTKKAEEKAIIDTIKELGLTVEEIKALAAAKK